MRTSGCEGRVEREPFTALYIAAPRSRTLGGRRGPRMTAILIVLHEIFWRRLKMEKTKEKSLREPLRCERTWCPSIAFDVTTLSFLHAQS